jgi:hypothetical protein
MPSATESLPAGEATLNSGIANAFWGPKMARVFGTLLNGPQDVHNDPTLRLTAIRQQNCAMVFHLFCNSSSVHQVIVENAVL